MENIREVIELCLEEQDVADVPQFVGIHEVDL